MSLRLVAEAAERTAAALERVTSVVPGGGDRAGLERQLVDLLRRSQAPELVDALRKALA